jgi:hypothetical protein
LEEIFATAFMALSTAKYNLLKGRNRPSPRSQKVGKRRTSKILADSSDSGTGIRPYTFEDVRHGLVYNNNMIGMRKGGVLIL